MTARRGLFVNIDGSSNGTAPSDSRLALAGLVADDGSSALAARNGVFYDGQGPVVSGNTDTGTMTYSVRACQFILYLLGTVASGAVVGINDALLKAATTAAPGSNSRIDVIWVRQHAVAAGDGGTDTDNIMQIGVAQGTAAASPTVPAIPTGAMALAQATVPAGTTSTNGLTITQLHGWTTTHGSAIPVRTSTERDAMTAFAGMTVFRLDLNRVELYNGTFWAPITHRPRRILTRTATFSLANNVVTAVGGWTADTGDDGNGTGLSYNGVTMITALTAGLYRVDYCMQFPSGGGGTGIFRIEILKNGTVGPPATGTIVALSDANTAGQSNPALSFLVVLAAGDTLQPAVFQNTGSAQTLGSTVASVVRWSVRMEDDA